MRDVLKAESAICWESSTGVDVMLIAVSIAVEQETIDFRRCEASHGREHPRAVIPN